MMVDVDSITRRAVLAYEDQGGRKDFNEDINVLMSHIRNIFLANQEGKTQGMEEQYGDLCLALFRFGFYHNMSYTTALSNAIKRQEFRSLVEDRAVIVGQEKLPIF